MPDSARSPIITLMSDLGIDGHSLAKLKGKISRLVQPKTIVDICHHYRSDQIPEIVAHLSALNEYFPAGTIHIVAVGIPEQESTEIHLCHYNDQVFISGNRNLFTLAWGDTLSTTYILSQIAGKNTHIDWMTSVSDLVFATTKGVQPTYLMQVQNTNKNQFSVISATGSHTISSKLISCSIASIDNFGNIVLNLKTAEFQRLFENKGFRIDLIQLPSVTSASKNYHDVAAGEPLLLMNSLGYLELAINRGSVADNLNLSNLSSAELFYERINIFFQ